MLHVIRIHAINFAGKLLDNILKDKDHFGFEKA